MEKCGSAAPDAKLVFDPGGNGALEVRAAEAGVLDGEAVVYMSDMEEVPSYVLQS